MRALGGVTFGETESLDGPVREREVDLPSGRTGVRRRQPEAVQQVLRDTVMTLVLRKAVRTLRRDPALASMALHHAELFEDRQMVERGGGTNVERRGDRRERGTPTGRHAPLHGLKRVHLTTAQALQNFHSTS
jgi:hypothetical protein